MRHVCKRVFCIFAVAGTAALGTGAEDGCAASATGFVDGQPCYALGGRGYAREEGQGFEAAALVGKVSLDQLSSPVVPLLYAPSTRRDGNVVVVTGASSKTLDPGTLIVFRTPSDSTSRSGKVRLRTGDATYPLRSRDAGAGTNVSWSTVVARRWHVAVLADRVWLLL